GRAPLVPDEVEVAVGRAHRDLELAGEVGGLDGLARLEALDGPEHPSQGRSCRRDSGLWPAGGAPLRDGHGDAEPYTRGPSDRRRTIEAACLRSPTRCARSTGSKPTES